jgi:hypothetical protein
MKPVKLMEIDFIHHESYVEIKITGLYNNDLAYKWFPFILSSCRLTGKKKVLIDFRNMSGDVAATEKIIYALKVTDYYKDYQSFSGEKLQIAYVGKSPQINKIEPAYNIAKEQNLPFFLSRSIDEALKWLKIN